MTRSSSSSKTTKTGTTAAGATAGKETLPARDFRQEVTESIIQLLEEGVAPWQKPWDGAAFLPMNHTTQKNYRGGNALHLMIVAIKRGYTDPRWMTYRQAEERGWQVRKGEKATQVEFWEIKKGTTAGKAGGAGKPGDGKGEGKDEEEAGDSEQQEKNRFIHRIYSVFNASQIDGVPALAIRAPNEFEAVEAGERILTNSGAKITHDQIDRAYYSRTADDIHLPRRELFPNSAGYYGTALHELAHWSGHPSRLNRTTLTETYRFGDENYAKEELRAELASVFLAAERGIPHDTSRHAAYVGNWIKALKDDKNEIFKAAHDASKAAEYILAFERRPEIAPEGEPNAPEPAPVKPVRKASTRSHAKRISEERSLTLDLDFGVER